MMGASALAVVAAAGLAGYVRCAPSDSGRWHVDLLATPSPGRRGVLVRAKGGDMAGPLVAADPAQVLARLDHIVAATPRTRRVAGCTAEGRVTYVTRSRWMGFPDYTTVAAEPAPGGARPVVLARLRFGRSDLGVNRRRVAGWLQVLSGG